MKPRICLTSIWLFLLVFSISAAHAVWSEQAEIISGNWGSGAGQFGLRSEGVFFVVPSIEYITPEKNVIISDPVNRKQMVFNSKGVLIEELKWSDAKGQEGKTIAPLSQKDREAAKMYSTKDGTNAYHITIVFPDKNLVVDSEEDFKIATRDDAGFVYGVSTGMVIRFDKTGKKTDVLSLPRPHEVLSAIPIPVPGGRTTHVMYLKYGEPVIAPNGDVYVWQKSNATYSVLKWTWQ
jgi:hypothetical protein